MGNAPAESIILPDFKLRRRIALIRGFAIPCERRDIVEFDARPVGVAGAEPVLSLGVALLGGEGEMLRRGIVIIARICFLAFAQVLHAGRFRLVRVFGFRRYCAGGHERRQGDDRQRNEKSPVEHLGFRHGIGPSEWF